ncbi:DNA-binding protein rif1 [Tieghemiomyces parasiticus]|uniref:DNA-binding protein rif1 n=1 Tax=Tieghemiomyces parasiticus TaxID=78921 RepID=A0A9W8ABE1_9FUNG|nr:DNA-binding protein rif1 [Tieghemiomyces parasiticus]
MTDTTNPDDADATADSAPGPESLATLSPVPGTTDDPCNYIEWALELWQHHAEPSTLTTGANSTLPPSSFSESFTDMWRTAPPEWDRMDVEQKIELYSGLYRQLRPSHQEPLSPGAGLVGALAAVPSVPLSARDAAGRAALTTHALLFLRAFLADLRTSDSQVVTQYALRCLAVWLSTPACLAAENPERLHALLLELIDRLDASQEKTSATLSLTCLTMAREHLVADRAICARLIVAVAKIIRLRPKAVALKIEAATLLDTAVSSHAEAAQITFRDWFPVAAENLFSSVPAVRFKMEFTLRAFYPYLVGPGLPPVNTGAAITSDPHGPIKVVLKDFLNVHGLDVVEAMNRLFQDGEERFAVRAWGIIVYYLGAHLVRSTTLNPFLKTLERGFNTRRPETKQATFKQWRSLIYSLALDGHLFREKHIRLVMVPLINCFSYEKIGPVRAVCFRTWTTLVYILGPQLATFYEAVVEPILPRALADSHDEVRTLAAEVFCSLLTSEYTPSASGVGDGTWQHQAAILAFLERPVIRIGAPSADPSDSAAAGDQEATEPPALSIRPYAAIMNVDMERVRALVTKIPRLDEDFIRPRLGTYLAHLGAALNAWAAGPLESCPPWPSLLTCIINDQLLVEGLPNWATRCVDTVVTTESPPPGSVVCEAALGNTWTALLDRMVTLTTAESFSISTSGAAPLGPTDDAPRDGMLYRCVAILASMLKDASPPGNSAASQGLVLATITECLPRSRRHLCVAFLLEHLAARLVSFPVLVERAAKWEVPFSALTAVLSTSLSPTAQQHVKHLVRRLAGLPDPPEETGILWIKREMADAGDSGTELEASAAVPPQLSRSNLAPDATPSVPLLVYLYAVAVHSLVGSEELPVAFVSATHSRLVKWIEEKVGVYRDGLEMPPNHVAHQSALFLCFELWYINSAAPSLGGGAVGWANPAGVALWTYWMQTLAPILKLPTQPCAVAPEFCKTYLQLLDWPVARADNRSRSPAEWPGVVSAWQSLLVDAVSTFRVHDRQGLPLLSLFAAVFRTLSSHWRASVLDPGASAGEPHASHAFHTILIEILDFHALPCTAPAERPMAPSDGGPLAVLDAQILVDSASTFHQIGRFLRESYFALDTTPQPKRHLPESTVRFFRTVNYLLNLFGPYLFELLTSATPTVHDDAHFPKPTLPGALLLWVGDELHYVGDQTRTVRALYHDTLAAILTRVFRAMALSSVHHGDPRLGFVALQRLLVAALQHCAVVVVEVAAVFWNHYYAPFTRHHIPLDDDPRIAVLRHQLVTPTLSVHSDSSPGPPADLTLVVSTALRLALGAAEQRLRGLSPLHKTNQTPFGSPIRPPDATSGTATPGSSRTTPLKRKRAVVWKEPGLIDSPAPVAAPSACRALDLSTACPSDTEAPAILGPAPKVIRLELSDIEASPAVTRSAATSDEDDVLRALDILHKAHESQVLQKLPFR